ncbi:hypothetical protein Poli38472_008474 [Pythium oligandrum]|uniref:Uncharacterized protein n=1 Tax=Pythium oligandrum TaxID=41045 RepID=A0A8K1C3L6_PYTOL|nr:hypothetical protein Poli38472_008474 [Pythium oligandrum]|eukprot:TMW55826.1 hypothetical protein Poli38472_008474 [Pythium oligandrum]
MDNFLQLMPMVTDAEGDSALVYGDDELVVGENHDALGEPMAGVHLSHEETSNTNGFFESLQSFATTEASRSASRERSESVVDQLSDQERYFHILETMESAMRTADTQLQHRLETMERILSLKDPMEQLSEYVAFVLQEEPPEEEVDVVPELLNCAQHLTDERDIEAALLGAFFFLDDNSQSRKRGLGTKLPAVAAMIEASKGLEQSFV